MNQLKALLFLFFLLLGIFSYSQKTYQVKGTITDTLENPLVSSTVLLLDMDSTMVSFTRSELDGSFKFKNVESGKYIVKSTYIGFLPLMVKIQVEDENIELDELQMVEMAEELMEVVIREAKAPVQIRGDTVIYDASTFQVPPGSTVEDLLKKLPGIEVDQDGSIKSDGQDVTKVTVDGKSFFGSDPKAATKNLPAEGISKVSVYDKASEQSEITGNNSNSEEKTMDLQLKEGFKTGGFGRIVGGVGTMNRAELKGNYNKFNEKIQFSLVGVGNNTGRNGLGWNDYQDFMGSQSYDFTEDGEYGFSSGRHSFYFGGGGNNIEGSIQSIFFGGNNSGLPQAYNGGANFNYDNNKTRFSSMYFYNFAGLDKITNTRSYKFLQDFDVDQTSQQEYSDRSQGHRAEVSFEHDIDSLHTAKFISNAAYIDENNEQLGSISLKNDDVLATTNDSELNSHSDGYLVNGMGVFRKKFKKEGRSLGLNSSYMYVDLNRFNDLYSNISFYDDLGNVTGNNIIDRHELRHDDKKKFTANGIFVEPIGKRFFSETFVNYKNTSESGEQDFLNQIEDNSIRDESISRAYNNQLTNTRVGTSLRYSYEGFNMSLGVAYLDIGIESAFRQLTSNDLLGEVDQSYSYWTPNFYINYSPVRSFYNSLYYSMSVNTPNINDLQPIIDNTNPLYIREGNPNLIPEFSQTAGIRSRKSFIASGIRLGGRFSYEWFDTQIINNETVDENLITYITPVNFEGGDAFEYSANFSLPILRNKLKFNLRYWGSTENTFAYVNNVLNASRQINHNPYLSIDITPSDNLGIYLSARYGRSDRKYEISTSQNQINTNITFDAELNTKLFFGLYFTSNFSYRTFRNDRFDFNQSIPILNASIYRHFLKDNKLEVRLSLYDAFNQNQGVSQFATDYGYSETASNSLQRYGMLSLTYNIKGIQSDLVKRNRWW